jgi:hypothetical protein
VADDATATGAAPTDAAFVGAAIGVPRTEGAAHAVDARTARAIPFGAGRAGGESPAGEDVIGGEEFGVGHRRVDHRRKIGGRLTTHETHRENEERISHRGDPTAKVSPSASRVMAVRPLEAARW